MVENSSNNDQPPRKKRRWYYKRQRDTSNDSQPPKQKQKQKQKQNPMDDNIQSGSRTQPPLPPPPPPSRQETLKQHERERIENEKQVSKMEHQLHEYFHKTNTPYSFINDTGIYKFTPQAPLQAPPQAPPQAPQQIPNPFMNIMFTLPNQNTNLWTSIFPFQNNIPVTAPVAPVAPTPPPPIVPELVEIRENIQHIDDLIALCDKYPLSESKKYNINMSAIHAIREPLTDLSNMIGMDTIKRTIVDQILYYLQELHIPENKSKTTMEASSGNTESTHTTEPLFNPFAAPFQPAVAIEPSKTTPPLFDFKTINQRISETIKKNQFTDDCGCGFAAPTKGDFMHTVIYGPPGSGKTEVAKIIGRIFSNLGILTKKTFKKVSRNDLVAGYLGQTAIKTKDMIKASLGGVLFIDEAYSLGNSEKRDSFAKECVDTLCEALSEHKHNWMVIIAGYEKELNDCFFSLNEGLNSRFTWRFKLDAYKPSELKSIYEKQVRDYGWTIASSGTTAALPESWFETRMDYFTTYGRDMETLFTKTKIAHSRRVFCLPMSEKKTITFDDLDNGFKLFIENPEVKERKERGCGPYLKTLYL